MQVLAEEVFDDEVKEGYVIRTDPVEGEILTDGQKITLYISKGPETKQRPMPNVVGQSLETAKTILDNQKLSLVIKQVEESSNTVAENVIIRTEPASGEDLKTGDSVTLYVSTGPKKAKMPDLVGEDITTAMARVQARGGQATELIFAMPLTAPHHNGAFETDESVIGLAARALADLAMNI
jgi:serine/threonine-protein kinase